MSDIKKESKCTDRTKWYDTETSISETDRRGERSWEKDELMNDKNSKSVYIQPSPIEKAAKLTSKSTLHCLHDKTHETPD